MTTAASNSASAKRMTTYEALAHEIKRRGIEAVFGLMSDDTALFISTLDSLGVRFYGARHENMGIAMAEGYASASGRMGVAITGRGPAMANGLHGAVYAQRTGSRVLLIFGAAATNAGPDLKDLDALGVMRAAGMRTFMVTHPDTACDVLGDAIAATDKGCAVMLLPVNVQFDHLSTQASAALAAAGPRPAAPEPARKSARPSALQAAAALLGASRRPLIIAGRGAHLSGAREAILALAERTGAIVGTSLKGKDMFRDYPYNVGVCGSLSHRAGRRYMDQADCIVAFGAGMNNRTTSNGLGLPLDAALIHIELEPSRLSRWSQADVAVIADAKRAAEQLLELMPQRPAADKPFYTEEVRRDLTTYDLSSEFQLANTPRTMDPRMLGIELDRLLPRDRNTVYDAGNFMQVQTYVSAPGPGCVKNAADFASVGMSFGTAMGFAVGAHERPTVLFIGDGGFLMTMGELETVVREDIPLVIVLMNDCAYGAEVHYLKERSAPVNLAVFPDVDYAPVAEAFGFEAHTVRTFEELRALAPLLAKPEGPILLDCKITASVVAPFILEAAHKEK